MKPTEIKELLTSFKATGGRLILKVRQNMHFIQRQKDEAVYARALDLGLNSIEATILANRTKDIDSLEKYISPRLKDIMDYNKLKDIDIATDLFIRHINNNSHIMLCTDVDQDGLGACSILYIFITDILKHNNVSYILSERAYGNGVNDNLTAKIVEKHQEKKIDLIAYADHGSSSGINIAKIMNLGIDTIITDHHTLSPDNAPYKYNAFINPQRPDCQYDKSISGATVAYLLCLSVAEKLNKDIHSEYMQYILSIAALTVISDSMRLDSITNRALVRYGLNIINSGKSKNWSRLIPEQLSVTDYKTLGFSIAPMINSASRMGDSIRGLFPFIEKDDRDIMNAVSVVAKLNKDRKVLQDELFNKVRDLQILEIDNKYTVVQIIDKGLGIQGIIASKFTNSEHKPAMIFYRDKKENLLQGSGRSARGVNLLKVLRQIEQENPEDVVKCGGHKEAAGFTIKEEFYNKFKELFDKYVHVELDTSDTPVDMEVKHPVDLEVNHLDYDLYKSVKTLAPYGQGWPEPSFITTFKLAKFTMFSRNGVDIYNLSLEDDRGVQINSMYFHNGDNDMEIENGMHIDIIYKVKYNSIFDKNIAMDILDIRKSTKVITF